MPKTAKELGVTDVNDPRQNIFGGAKYLREQLNRFGGDVEKALAAYNAGPTRVMTLIAKTKSWEDTKKVLPEETQKYIPSILARQQAYKKLEASVDLTKMYNVQKEQANKIAAADKKTSGATRDF
jgi:soluble lytic murein transglycosylase-like protein